MNKEKFICVAKIGRPHGVRGQVSLSIYTDDITFITGEEGLFDKNGKFICNILELSPHKNSYIAKIKDVNDRNKAEELKNTELYIERSKLPEIVEDEDSFYYVDLENLDVFKSGEAEVLGKVKAVQNFGASDILEIIDFSSNKSFLIPFTKKFVPEVNIASGYIKIDLPDNFFKIEKPQNN